MGEGRKPFPKQDFKPFQLNPKEASREQWERYHAYRRIRQKEMYPDDPIVPDEQVEKEIKFESPHYKLRYFQLDGPDRLISVMSTSYLTQKNPGFEENKHLMFVGGSVHPDFRRRGIASMWLPSILDLMKEESRSVIQMNVDDEKGHGFMKWLGAEEKWSGAENRLNFTQLDWDLVNRWVDEGPKSSPGANLEFYEGRLPESLWADYLPVYETCMNMAPREDLEVGDVKFTPEVWRDFYKQVEQLELQHHTYISREADGRISGLTEIFYNAKKPGFITQELTGVLPEFRGRKTGKWLKAAMLKYVREKYPDTRWVVTGNAGSNAPMLAINHTLGFKQYKAASGYQLHREKLEARISELGL